MLRRLEAIPEAVGGYELGDFWAVIDPVESTNLITNPSFELATTGYTAVSSAIARVTTWQRRGAYGLRITPNAGAEAGVYFGTVSLTAGQQYAFSVDFQGDAGKTYNLYFATTGAARLATYTFKASGDKQRISVTYAETSTTTRRLYLTRNSYSDTNVFYTDGWQLENKAYPTTYFDGDSTGFVPGERAYLWNGTRHASTSWRSAQTRSGGKEVRLKDVGFSFLAILGMGMGPVANIAQPYALGGAYYQDTVETERQFTLVGTVQGISLADLRRVRKDLIDYFKPDRTRTPQPLVLTYQETDTCGNPTMEKLWIPCLYQEGLQGNITNDYQEAMGLQFVMYLPMIQAEGEKGAALGFQTSVANANYIAKRSNLGLWGAMGTGGNADVRAICQGLDGTIFVGGEFTQMGGVADTAYIAQWTGTAWQPLSTGMNNYVLGLAVQSDGKIVAVGAFTTAGGGAANRIAVWDGANWAALGAGLNNTVRAVVIGYDGTIFVAGDFTTAGGGAATYIAKWTGAAWAACGDADDIVSALAIGPGGILYAAGSFLNIGGIAAARIARRIPAGTWYAMDAGIGNNAVYALTIGLDGRVFAAGSFTLIHGETINYIAYWTGSHWNPLSSGPDADVYGLATLSDGSIFAGGSFDQVGYIELLDRAALWLGSAWQPLDINLPGTNEVYCGFEDRNGNFYIGYSDTGAALSATNATYNGGSASAYPRFIFNGPGQVSQLKNYTSGKVISFNLVLMADELAILDLDPLNLGFWSNLRGSLRNTIIPGSDLNFELLPGVNNISVFIYGSTDAGTSVTMTWKDQYWSLDGAIH